MRSLDQDGVCTCAVCRSKIYTRELKCPSCRKVTEHFRVIHDLAEGCVWACPSPCLEDHEYHSPTHLHEGKWWFWGECWVDRYGPYDSEDEARQACGQYADAL